MAAATLAKLAKNKYVVIFFAIIAISTIVYQILSEESTKFWFSASFLTSPSGASAENTIASSGSAQVPNQASVVVEALSPWQALSPKASVSLFHATPPDGSASFRPVLGSSPAPALASYAPLLVVSPSPSLISPPPVVSSVSTPATVSFAAPPQTSSDSSPPNSLDSSPPPQLFSPPPPIAASSPNSSPSIVSLSPNLTNSPPSPSSSDTGIVRKQVPEWRMKVEQELRQAKQEIQAATAANSMLELPKSVYLDVYKFQKSYERMEKIFKVYMYKEGKPNLVHKGPLLGIYASEGWFIREMNQNRQFVTEDPQAAHMYYLPFSSVHVRFELYPPGTPNKRPIADFIRNYINQIASLHPFWNMTKGSDHFFVSCHDWGPAMARYQPELRKNAVKVVCNADLTEEFVLSKDASLLETFVHSLKLPTRLGGPGPSRRPILAFFAGQLHGRARPILLQYWKDKDPDMKIYEKLPREIAKRMSYEQHMKSSKYCICARGYEVNSPRVVESIYNDCVPVLLADNFVLPFSEVLDWSAFSVTVAEADIPRLKQILLSIPEARYRKMQARLKMVRKHFLWHDRAEKYDAFNMILHSVWHSRLQQLDNIAKLEQRQLQTGV